MIFDSPNYVSLYIIISVLENVLNILPVSFPYYIFIRNAEQKRGVSNVYELFCLTSPDSGQEAS